MAVMVIEMLQRVAECSDGTFLHVGADVGPVTEELHLAELKLHLRDVRGAKGDVVGIYLAGVGNLLRGRHVAPILLCQPLEEGFDHEVEKQGGEGVALEGPSVNGHRGGGAMGCEERGGGVGIQVSHYAYEIGGHSQGVQDGA